jgi:hypothetical protein
MAKIQELKNEIEGLTKKEFTELYRWLSDRELANWDKEIAADSEGVDLIF